MKHMGGPAE